MRKISGIFYLKNNLNNKVYVGQSANIQTRIAQLLSDYKKRNTPLYEDMREYGIENFFFSIIEFCPRHLLLSERIRWENLYAKKHGIYQHRVKAKKFFTLNNEGEPHIVLKKYECPLSLLFMYNIRENWFAAIPNADIPADCRSNLPFSSKI